MIAWPISGNPTHHKDFLMRHQASWRDKTNSNYGSSFTKWANWCKQRNRDPHTGPTADVANFLSYLFSQGYQH